MLDSTLDEAVLQVTGDNAIAWVTRHLPQFSPWGPGGIANPGMQALSELAIAWVHLQPTRFTVGWPASALETWRDTIAGYCEDPLYARAARQSPARALFVLLPYLLLRSTGYRWPRHEDTLQWMQRLGFPQAAETIPYRQVDRQYFLWKSGWALREPNWAQLCRHTVLRRVRSDLHVDDEAAYSITHTLLYLSQFGNREVTMDARLARRATTLVDGLLLHYWRIGNWDLLGELLINAMSLPDADPVVFAGAASAFSRGWRPDGAHPASREAERRVVEASGARHDDAVFRHCYHTTLVGVLHCAAVLGRLLPRKNDEASTTTESDRFRTPSTPLDGTVRCNRCPDKGVAVSRNITLPAQY